jgi:hypothetical protein
MKEKLLNLTAVLAGAAVTGLGTLKCCMLPALFSLLGLAGTSAALLARWLSPALMLLSVTLLARSFYSLYVQRRGTRAAELVTWASSALVVMFWIYRLYNGSNF